MNDDRSVIRDGPGVRWRLWECNPLHLLSAVCMLTGCLLIRTDLAEQESWAEVLSLIAIFNLYELLVLALGLHLVRAMGRYRVGWELLALEVFFLADTAFLYRLLTGEHAGLGTAAAIIGLVLAIAKTQVMFRLAGLPRSRTEARHGAAVFALMFGFPLIAEWTARFQGPSESFPAWVLFAGWWLVGAIAATVPLGFSRALPGAVKPSAARTLRIVYTVVPMAALLLHVGSLHWAFEVTFTPAFAAPLMLGVAIALIRRGWLSVPVHATVAAAAALAMMGPGALEISLSAAGETVSPLRLILTAGAGVYLWAFLRSRRSEPAYVGGSLLLAASMGHSPAAMAGTLVRLASGVRDAIPSTAKGWGIAAVAAAFVLLALTAAVSLRRRPARVNEDG